MTQSTEVGGAARRAHRDRGGAGHNPKKGKGAPESAGWARRRARRHRREILNRRGEGAGHRRDDAMVAKKASRLREANGRYKTRTCDLTIVNVAPTN